MTKVNSLVCGRISWMSVLWDKWLLLMFWAPFIFSSLLKYWNLFRTWICKQNRQRVKPPNHRLHAAASECFSLPCLVDLFGVSICLWVCMHVWSVVGWMWTSPYGDNEKEASLGGTASVCPQVVCVCLCVCMCLRVRTHVYVSAGEPSGTLAPPN